jgi:hypothetical protein
MKKYERRYRTELTAVITMAQKELEMLDANCLFTPSSGLLTALKEACEAGIRLEVAIDCEDEK